LINPSPLTSLLSVLRAVPYDRPLRSFGFSAWSTLTARDVGPLSHTFLLAFAAARSISPRADVPVFPLCSSRFKLFLALAGPRLPHSPSNARESFWLAFGPRTPQAPV